MQQETFSNKEHSLQIQESVNGKDVYIVQTGRGGPQVPCMIITMIIIVKPKYEVPKSKVPKSRPKGLGLTQ